MSVKITLENPGKDFKLQIGDTTHYMKNDNFVQIANGVETITPNVALVTKFSFDCSISGGISTDSIMTYTKVELPEKSLVDYLGVVSYEIKDADSPIVLQKSDIMFQFKTWKDAFVITITKFGQVLETNLDTRKSELKDSLIIGYLDADTLRYILEKIQSVFVIDKIPTCTTPYVDLIRKIASYNQKQAVAKLEKLEL